MYLLIRHRPVLLFLVVAAVLGFAACVLPAGPGTQGIPSLVGNRRVLFVGNSHTYQNDLPGMLVSLAHASGDTALRAGAVAYPNFALEDHFAQGDAAKALSHSGWEFVVMQQGTLGAPRESGESGVLGAAVRPTDSRGRS